MLSDCRSNWEPYVATIFNKVQFKRRHINYYEHSRYTSNEKTNKKNVLVVCQSWFIGVKQN